MRPVTNGTTDPAANPQTIAELVRRGASVLESAGFLPDEAKREAAVLGRAMAGWDEARWLADQREQPPHGFTGTFLKAIDRRARREPVAYIVGRREFYGRTFLVTPDVLIPRPETERLVETALEACAASGPSHADVLDIGTGSGCVAVTLACEHPGVRAVATDTSEAALAVARRNASSLGVAERVSFERISLAGGRRNAFDLVVSNPPYIAEPDRPTLPPDVREFEPAEALFAGSDGLAVIRSLVPAAWVALRPGGWLLIEIGWNQAESVLRLLGEAGFTALRIVEDLAGHPRIAVARKPEDGHTLSP